MLIPKPYLVEFLTQSNMIEGIIKFDMDAQLSALDTLLSANDEALMDGALLDFALAIEPAAILRDQPGMDVQVGHYFPPNGGPDVAQTLNIILDDASWGADPYDIHCRYEELHPLMDGNGRSGRALWLWQEQFLPTKGKALSFLHWFYYQSLNHYRMYAS